TKAVIDGIEKNDRFGEFAFVRGDKRDEIFKSQYMDPNKCVGMTLNPGDACQIFQKVSTRDQDKPNSGQNFGRWFTFATIVYHDPNDIKNVKTTGSHASVNVQDPLFTPTPEPSSFALLAIGSVGVLG